MDASARQPSTDLVGALEAAGGIGRDLLAVDWEATPLGAPEGWSRSLTSIVRVVVSSRFSMWMAWGPELTFFCNDAYQRDTLAAKYPWALGRPAYEVWEEIWPEIGPRIDAVMSTGAATWDEALLLFLERSGFREETYHTFSYSPLTDDDGTIVGMLCVVAEETDRVIGERHLALLRDLGAEALEVRDEASMLQGLSRHLAAGDRALPFTLTYLLDGPEEAPRLAAASGVPAGHPIAARAWPVAEALATGGALVDLRGEPDLPRGPWEDPPEQALVLPLARPGQEGALGVLVAGLNPYRPVDATLRSFVDLVAAQVSGGLASARALEAERSRAESLAELDRAKTAFFTNVSHELRTPLTLLLGPAEDALGDRGEPLPDGQRRRMEVIARNGRRMLTLVNTLLDFSRIESGGDVARFEPVDLVRATRELLGMFSSAAELAGLELRLEADRLPGPVHVDREGWTKVVSNLLSNALKHTFAGSIVVRLRAEGEEAVLEVADTGVGIAPADQERLFERFHRVEGARSRTHEGTGIGLALVAEIVAQHGGRIAVRSAEGQGSTFAVRLPLGTAHLPPAQVAEAAPAQREEPDGAVGAGLAQDALRWLAPDAGAGALPVVPPPPVPTGGERAPRVLVVDDNADMRRYIGDLLRPQHDVEEAADGGAALEAARRRPPDLVLTDVMMPVLDGFGLLRGLRDDPATAGVPVIMLSARGGEESTVEGLEAGADDYLVKPFAARELLARVDANLELERVRRARDELDRTGTMLDQAERMAGMGSWELDLRRDRFRLSRQLLAMYELTKEELDELGLEALIDLRAHPGDRTRLRGAFEHAFATGSSLDVEARIVLPSGATRLVRALGEVLVDDEGEAALARGSVQDVTAQRRMEAELVEAEREREVARREHEIATELQRSLLPIRAFEAPGMEVATYYRAGVEGTQVGGDWFDVIERPDGRTAIVLGDVMGRGVRAAAVMGQLRSAARAYAKLDLAPDEVLTLLDGVVGDLGDDQMATCVYAVHDAATATLRYASGGHLPPLLREPGRGTRRLDGATGPPLGSGVGHPGAGEVAVEPGAIVALYTDGLVERRGSGVDEGIDQLAGVLADATVPLVALPGALVAGLVGERVDDDVAVLVARFGEAVERPEVRRAVPADPRSVPDARHAAGQALAGWGVDPARRADAALLVSELVTNAVLHAREPIELVLTAHPQHVLIEVIDGSPAPPDPREADREEESGRGLALVESLAVLWGGRTTARGKVVWAVVER